MPSTADGAAPNTRMAEYWASANGQKWVANQENLDRLFGGIATALLDAAHPLAGERGLDLGCGTGATTLALAERLTSGGHALGIDISPVMLRLAQQRAATASASNAEFQEADAQVFGFKPASRDLLISRFGCMFFNDPVAAFGNLRAALCSGGRMQLAAWGPISGNPWFAIPRDAAIARLGAPPKAEPREPGPLAFADHDYAIGLLRDAGFTDVSVDTRTLDLIAPDTLPEAAALAANLGPAARIVSTYDGTAEDIAAITEAVRSQIAAYQTDGGIRVPAEIHFFSARTP